MPASFLHGVETIEIEKGARTIKTVKTDETKTGFNFVRKNIIILFLIINRKLLLMQ